MITKGWLTSQNELLRSLNEDGQFYWSQIAAEIRKLDEPKSAVQTRNKSSLWARRMVPTLGILTLLVIPLVHLIYSARDETVIAREVAPLGVAELAPASDPILSVSTEVSTVSYYANAGDVTVIWVKDGGLGYLP